MFLFSWLYVSQEKGTDSLAKSSSQLSTRPNGPSFVPPMVAMDNDDGISFKGVYRCSLRVEDCYLVIDPKVV